MRLLLSLGALVVLGAGCWSPAPPKSMSEAELSNVGVEIGERAPDFRLTSFTGERTSLSQYQGQPVILDFWAGWCPFCLREMPALDATYRAHRDIGLTVIGVHRGSGESMEDGASFANELDITFPLLQDKNDHVYNLFSGGVPAMPLAVFIDRDGIIRHRIFGPKSLNQLERLISDISIDAAP
jgi:peroxiredoxin